MFFRLDRNGKDSLYYFSIDYPKTSHMNFRCKNSSYTIGLKLKLDYIEGFTGFILSNNYGFPFFTLKYEFKNNKSTFSMFPKNSIDTMEKFTKEVLNPYFKESLHSQLPVFFQREIFPVLKNFVKHKEKVGWLNENSVWSR